MIIITVLIKLKGQYNDKYTGWTAQLTIHELIKYHNFLREDIIADNENITATVVFYELAISSTDSKFTC